MRPAELDAARRAILDGGWGDRQRELEFYVNDSPAHLFVAEAADGAIVGTSIATQHGRAGWVGLVFVAPAWRGRGLGGVLTETALQKLQDLGCSSMLLVATALGRPIYLRLGFQDAGGYTVYSGKAARVVPRSSEIREFTASDLADAVRLDREATGEDRARVLDALVRRGTSGWVIGGADTVRGFAFRTPWGFGPVVAFAAADAQALLEMSLSQAEASAPVSVTVPTENLAAQAFLASRGLEQQRPLPRMVLGERIAWQPHAIWAIVNFALG
jgi:GNAT superfamily N-acetyltransferase